MVMTRFAVWSLVLLSTLSFAAADDNVPPAGFVALFNGKDLTGWKGLPIRPNPKDATKVVALTMPERLSLPADELAAAQKLADESARAHWRVENGVIVFDGKGQNLCTAKDYGNFELYVDWKIEEDGDSGIYVRGSPQIQIWDPDVSPKYHNGERVGSGGMFNNKNHPNKASKIADKPVGEWNTFWIRMVGDKVTVKLNGETVVDDVVLENYWDKERATPIYPKGTIELQNHGNTLYFKNIYLKELP
jgi:hypothetical protein